MQRLIFAAVLLVTWGLWSGHTVLTGDPDVWMNLFAVGAIAAVVAMSARMGIDDDEGIPLAIHTSGLFTYVPWLVWQVVVSNVDVAKRVFTMDLDPKWITTVPKQHTAIGRVLYANSITLTPGTVSVRMFDAEILVHALHQGTADDVMGDDMNERVANLERSDAGGAS